MFSSLPILISLSAFVFAAPAASSAEESTKATTVQVTHMRIVAAKDIDVFMPAFESRLGKHNLKAYQSLLKDPSKKAEVERIIAAQAGTSGLINLGEYDHGALLAIKGAPRLAKLYLIGNPLIAARMTENNISAALYSPLKILVYGDTTKRATIEYDLPSTQFGQFFDVNIDRVAKELDAKVKALISGI